MEKIVLDKNFFDDLYSLEITEESYRNYDLITNLLINKKDSNEDYELFTDGYVADLIYNKFSNIKNVDEIKFEINKLELFANNLPLDVSKKLFSNDKVLDSMLILKPRILENIFKESDIKLLTLITNLYLKKLNKEKEKLNKMKEDYETLVETKLLEQKIDTDYLINVKKEIEIHLDKIKNQNQREEKCLAFVMSLNNLLLDSLSQNSKNIIK